MFCTLKEELFLGVVDAMFHNVGATFCKDGTCGVDNCTFHTVEWDSLPSLHDEANYTHGGHEFPLVKQIKELLALRKDRTIFTVLREELADKHRRAVANYIALLKPDHLFAQVLRGSESWVQAVTEGSRKDGHARYQTVVTESACSTSVKMSRFKDFNVFSETSKSVGAVINQLRHQHQFLMYKFDPPTAASAPRRTTDTDADTEEGRPSKPVVKKLFDAFSEDRPDYGCMLLEAIRNSSLYTGSSGGVLPPGRQIYFAPALADAKVEGLDMYPRSFFNVVHSVKYMPGVGGAEVICGGGVEDVARQIKIAKRAARSGPLDMRSNGEVIGWDALPTPEHVERVHRASGGTRSFNAWFGPMALEKCHEFQLPYVDKDPCTITMADHERDAYAHSFVLHEAFLTRPRLLIYFTHDEDKMIRLDEAHVTRLLRTVQTIGVGMHCALIRHRQDTHQIDTLAAAFASFLKYANDTSVVELASRADGHRASNLHGHPLDAMDGADNRYSHAVVAARMATLTYADTPGEWKTMYNDFRDFASRRGITQNVAAPMFLHEAMWSLRARATLFLFGYWFEVDANGAPWPAGSRHARVQAPFDPSEMCDIGTLKFRCPSTDGVQVGCLRAPAHADGAFALEVYGHTSVSLTRGHILVLEEAVRTVLGVQSARIATAAATKWAATLPGPTRHGLEKVPTVFRGCVIANALFRNHGNALRAWVGILLLRTTDGEVHELTYRSVLVENAADRKRKRGDQHGEHGFGPHRFPGVFGLDYSRRLISASGMPGLACGDNVIVTSYLRQNPDFVVDIKLRYEATHAIIISTSSTAMEVDNLAVAPKEPNVRRDTCGVPPRLEGDAGMLSPGCPHGLAIVPIFELTKNAHSPILDGLNASLSFLAFPLQRTTKGNAGLIREGQHGTGKSTTSEHIMIIYGENSARTVKKIDKEVERQFGQEFSNTLLVLGDDVGEGFIKACFDATLKEMLTHDTITCERKHVQLLTSSENNMTIVVNTNIDRRLLKKLRRRWSVICCANGLKIVGVGGEAASRYHAQVRESWDSPWSNAGVLCFLDTYPLVPSLETYSACKNETMAALSDAPTELHLRFIKWLVELRMESDAKILAPSSESEMSAFEQVGWGESSDMSWKDMKTLIDSWHKWVCARRESGLCGAATAILHNLAKLIKTDAALLEMNTAAKDGTFHITRVHITRSLAEQGYRVEPPARDPFFTSCGWKEMGMPFPRPQLWGTWARAHTTPS
jgi:hypothetical protein